MRLRISPISWILLGGAIIRIWLAFHLPLYPAKDRLVGFNDEPMHLRYAKQVAESRHWPIWTREEAARDSLIGEYPQPPTYYALAGGIIGCGGGLAAVRVWSALLGVLAGWVVYRYARLVSDRDDVHLAAAVAATFSPVSVIFTSLVTNDALLVLSASLALFQLERVRRGADGRWGGVIFGLAVGVAIWSKMSALALVPMIWFAVSKAAQAGEWRARAEAGIAALVIASPLMVWNLVHYQQIVPTVSIIPPLIAIGSPQPGIFHPLLMIEHLFRSAAQPLQGAWGGAVEPWASLVWVACGGVLLILGIKRTVRNDSGRMLLTALGLSTVALISYNVKFAQVEFRLLAPAFLPMAVIAGEGVTSLKIPVAVQCLFWIAPLLLMYLFGG